MKDKIICSRCGKEIHEAEDLIKLTGYDPLHCEEESYWCRLCYEMFMADLED